MTKTNRPNANELELSLFGAGIGECAVVHLGAANWMVVDSCLDETGQAVALRYLDELGIDIGDVKLIVVTHWHDDHIRGVSQIVKRASSARFACSGALKSPEFMTLVFTSEEMKLVEHKSGVSEFAAVLKIIEERRKDRGPDYWAQESTCLYTEATPYCVNVYALSPSPQAVTDSSAEIARLIPMPGQTIRPFARVAPNDTSVALLVRTSGLHFLLGADLENCSNARRGWKAIINSAVLPKVMSSAFKVAHHGSKNADHADIWSKLLVNNPYSVLTPYAGGSNPLPSASDIDRIKSHASNSYCTVWPPTQAPPTRRSIERTVREVTRSHRAIRKQPGHIRLRAPIDGGLEGFSVELFDGAQML